TLPIEWATAAAQVACADGSHVENGACVADSLAVADVSGGCSAGKLPGLLIAGAVIALVIVTRRRRALLVIAIGACTLSGGTWDDAVDDGPTGDIEHLDVFSADLGDGDGVQYLLANQQLVDGAQEPVAQFALARHAEGIAIARVPGACGDRLV